MCEFLQDVKAEIFNKLDKIKIYQIDDKFIELIIFKLREIDRELELRINKKEKNEKINNYKKTIMPQMIKQQNNPLINNPPGGNKYNNDNNNNDNDNNNYDDDNKNNDNNNNNNSKLYIKGTNSKRPVVEDVNNKDNAAEDGGTINNGDTINNHSQNYRETQNKYGDRVRHVISETSNSESVANEAPINKTLINKTNMCVTMNKDDKKNIYRRYEDLKIKILNTDYECDEFINFLNVGGYGAIFIYRGFIFKLYINNRKIDRNRYLFQIYNEIKCSTIFNFINFPLVITQIDQKYFNKLKYLFKYIYYLLIIYYTNDYSNIEDSCNPCLKKFMLLLNKVKENDYDREILTRIVREVFNMSTNFFDINDHKINNYLSFFLDIQDNKNLTHHFMLMKSAISDAVHFLKKIPINKFLHYLKLLFLQISIAIYNLNIRYEFMHNDLKLDNILVFENVYENLYAELEGSHPIKIFDFSNEDFIFKINDFDLLLIEKNEKTKRVYNKFSDPFHSDNPKEMNANFAYNIEIDMSIEKCPRVFNLPKRFQDINMFDKVFRTQQLYWYNDLGYLAITIPSYFKLRNPEIANKYGEGVSEFMNILWSNFIKDNKFHDNSRVLLKIKNPFCRNIGNLYKFITSDIFKEWQLDLDQ